MDYWNRDNFEGLAAIADEAMAAAIPEGFARYCRLRSAGQRRPALEALRGFLAEAQSRPPDERRRITAWLLDTQWHAPQVHQLLPHPLLKGLVEPTVEAWRREFPGDAAAHRWHGVVHRDLASLRAALRLGPGDALARAQLATELLAGAEFSTHHLVESEFLGDASQAAHELSEAEALIAGLPDGERRDVLHARCADQRALVDDWQAYQLAPQGTFPEWCAQRGKAHAWPSIVYYGKADEA